MTCLGKKDPGRSRQKVSLYFQKCFLHFSPRLCSWAELAGPPPSASSSLCFVFFPEMVSQVRPQKETEKGLRKNMRRFITLPGARGRSTWRPPRGATWGSTREVRRQRQEWETTSATAFTGVSIKREGRAGEQFRAG